ncbi:glutathione import ATP-binding protein GsiA [Demequina sediminis]|uniref:Glutathione import ATP-binding protein GsiA n=1 Tax=Demequina sediminis TaxID=1930058 RepID=A0ABP9WKY4_9MICO|nr:ABC transporter ATP-binding protein [Demequina sediminis]BDZ61571.1 ABC transporter ATP-binding protein [Demequina sediminis]
MTVRISELSVVGPAGVMVEPLSATVEPGATLALIGESGSGKTLTAKSLVGLLPRGFTATGAAEVGGVALPLAGGESAWRAIRGRTASLLLQDPFTSLSPVHRCGDQIAWTVEAATGSRLARSERDAVVEARLAEVKLPARAARAYPHQLSGGMRQRVAIAAALASDPQLLIADEPTTALDASNQAEILDLLRAVQVERRLSVILISHDLGVVRGRTDQVLVMREGHVVERGETASVLAAPSHPYTGALIEADPVVAAQSGTRLSPAQPVEGELVVRVMGLEKSFGTHRVLDDVSLDVSRGEILGIVGESGSGKSTLARCVAGLEHEDGGTISIDGVALAPGRASRTPDQMQIVFQDPYSSLNPMMSVGAILAEALRVAGRDASEVDGLLETVGLPAQFVRKRPAQLSGGQRQRVAIARALAPRPRLLICDESVSALDVSVQADILRLLAGLRDELGIAVMFISHDLAVVRMIADSVVVMWNGRVVERGECRDVLTAPTHEYTRLLVAAALRENTAPQIGRE